MQIEMRLLTKDEVGRIYREHLVQDFPADEVKPLWAIHRMMDDGCYDSFGLFADNVLRGYAFFVRRKEAVLIDYYAMLSDCRGMGFGSLFLEAMKEYYRDVPGILFEVERPEAAHDEDDRVMRERRIAFYNRNGLKETGIMVTVFDVPFRMLYLPCGEDWEVEEEQVLRERLIRVYRYMIPEELYVQKIIWY